MPLCTAVYVGVVLFGKTMTKEEAYKIRKAFFDVIFDKNDFICYGNMWSTSLTTVDDTLYKALPYSQTKKDGTKMGMVWTQEFFALNSFKKDTRRCAENVACFRTFLFEIDCLPKETQEHIIVFAKKNYNLPMSTLLFSGNKSYHILVSLEEPITIENLYGTDLRDSCLVPNYKEIWWKIAKMITFIFFEFCKKNNVSPIVYKKAKDKDGNSIIVEKLMDILTLKEMDKSENVICDTQVNVPSNFTRFPEVKRPDKKKIQSVRKIYSRIPKKEFEEFLKTCPNYVSVEKKNYETQKCTGYLDFDNSKYDKYEFLSIAPKHVISKIDDIRNNASSEQMHESIRSFYNALFSIKPMMTVEYALELCEDLVYPYLRQAGYSEKKIYNNDLVCARDYQRKKDV